MVLALTVTACASTTPSPESTVAPMWRDMISQKLADPNTSEFQRQVLADYQVSDDEAEEAVDGYVQCMADHGWTAHMSTAGTGGFEATPGGPQDPKAVPNMDDYLNCQAITTDIVLMVYNGMKDNPQGLTRPQLIRACYQAHDVPDGAELSDDAFAQLVNDSSYRASTPQGKLCFYDPTGSEHMTVDEAVAHDAVESTATPQ